MTGETTVLGPGERGAKEVGFPQTSLSSFSLLPLKPIFLAGERQNSGVKTVEKLIRQIMIFSRQRKKKTDMFLRTIPKEHCVRILDETF